MELKSISESDKFVAVELKITEFDLRITPIAKTVNIVLTRPEEFQHKLIINVPGEVDGK